MTQFPIGTFSRVTKLPISTLRYYHEIGLLSPDHVDEASNYRFYGDASIDRARAIVALRELGLSLPEIQAALKDEASEADLREILVTQRAKVESEVKKLKERAHRLDVLLAQIDAVPSRGSDRQSGVELCEIPEVLFGGVRHEGPWSDFGRIAGTVARKAGRHIGGPAISLCHDEAYEETAHYEAGFVLRRPVKGLACRPLESGPAIRAIHIGPYSNLEFTYERMMREAIDRGLEVLRPTREFYLKGPGLIFPGRPDKYRTEIVLRVNPGR